MTRRPRQGKQRSNAMNHPKNEDLHFLATFHSAESYLRSILTACKEAPEAELHLSY